MLLKDLPLEIVHEIVEHTSNRLDHSNPIVQQKVWLGQKMLRSSSFWRCTLIHPDAHGCPPAQRLTEKIIGLRAPRSAGALMSLKPVSDRKTLKLVRCAIGNGWPDFELARQQQAGRVRSLSNFEGQSGDLEDDALSRPVRDTAREAVQTIDAICVAGETTKRMEEVGKPQARSKLEVNLAQLESSFGPDVQIGIVGKTEGREPVPIPDSFTELKQPGIFEGDEGSSGNSRTRMAPSQLEENVRKLEQSFPPELRAGIVGKTEGRECMSSSARFIDSEALGNRKENVDKAETQNSPGTLESSVGKAESQNARGKLDEKVKARKELLGADVGKLKLGKAEKADLRPVENPDKTESKPSGESEQRKAPGKTEPELSGKEGGGHSVCVIHLASKGSAEAEYVEKLKSGDVLQLPDGAVVITAAQSKDTSVRDGFDVNAYLKNLTTCQFGRLVLYSSLIPSTHTLLSQNFHSFPAGTICVADAQLQGRGRAGNVWQSPKGCLMFSYTTQMTNGRMVPFLQYVVSLAVIEGVEETCKVSGIPAPDVKIKWPNDLYAKGLKIGGVLCTSSFRAKTFNIVVGVGLNLRNREPTTCLDALIEELQGGSTAIQQELLLAAIMSRFEILNKIFQEKGFLPLQEAYYRKWLHTGQSVVLEEREPGSSSTSKIALTILGLTPLGYLLASDDVGEKYELHPDGNSLDFLKGLLRQKLPM